MREITKEELKDILERHLRWMHETEGWSEDDRADLQEADLQEANLWGADLQGADLRGANLRGAKNIDEAKYLHVPYSCPDFGMFIGWKKAGEYIIQLEVPEDAKRLSATGRKCRCNRAKVLAIQNIDGTPAGVTEVPSGYDRKFIYKVGEVVEVKDFNENRWDECSEGIHFFITRQEAEEY